MRALLPLFAAACLVLPVAVHAGHDHACSKGLQTCLDSMVRELRSTGFIGVILEDAKGALGEMVVAKVVPGAPAEKAGIEAGDVLVALNGISFAKHDWKKMAEVKKPGREVTCTIRRGGASQDLKLTLAPMPADLMAKYIGEHMMKHAKRETHADR